MTLQRIFNRIVAEKGTAHVTFDSRRDYDSVRVSLLRKFRDSLALFYAAGIDGYSDSFVSCSYDSATGLGTFVVKSKAQAQRVKRTYLIPDNL